MSLNVYLYREDIPVGMRVVRMNDAFFQKVKLVNDETTRKLLKSIDQAEYGNETMFISRNKKMGLINKDYLSTGCKTLLNAYYYPDICFDMLECGRNVKFAQINKRQIKSIKIRPNKQKIPDKQNKISLK